MILRRLFYVVAVLLFSFTSFAQSPCPKTMEVTAANLSLETFFDVSCSTFEKSIGWMTKLRQICSKDTIAAFQNLISKSKKSNRKPDIDVRVKIRLRRDNESSSTTLCMDKFGNIILNDHLIRKNKRLIKLVRECLPQEVL